MRGIGVGVASLTGVTWPKGASVDPGNGLAPVGTAIPNAFCVPSRGGVPLLKEQPINNRNNVKGRQSLRRDLIFSILDFRLIRKSPGRTIYQIALPSSQPRVEPLSLYMDLK